MIFCFCHRGHIRVLWRCLMCFFNGFLIVVLMWFYCFFHDCWLMFNSCLWLFDCFNNSFWWFFDGVWWSRVSDGFLWFLMVVWWFFDGFCSTSLGASSVFSSLWRPSRPGPGRTAPSSGTFGDFSWDFKGKNLGMSWIFREIQQNSGDCCIPSGKLT